MGRGLCRIKQRETREGFQDLLTAAALEPNRSLLRSYLGKAFADADDDAHANQELLLAQRLDPQDPTPILYRALLDSQENQVGRAVQDLQRAIDLNDNRQVYRSKFLLDQDRAVASANLAALYRDAGMTDVSVAEAAKSVNDDYANSSAHLFLSDSYFALRDPTGFNLRYETVWFNELLLANLLSPVGGGRLAQNVSDQEYSRLLSADGFGIANTITTRSDIKSISEQVSQFGTSGRSSYSFDLDYDHADGFRVNNDLDSIHWYSTIKQQVTDHDTAMALIEYENYDSGDNFEYYNQTNARPYYRFQENQEPSVVGGWDHEWSPTAHTLLLGGRLVNNQHFSDQTASQLLLIQDAGGKIANYDIEPFGVDYNSQSEIYTMELNQIQQWNHVTLSAGGRYQAGSIDAQTTLTNPPSLGGLFPGTTETSSETGNFERLTGYAYLTLQPWDHVWLTGGFADDNISYPSNYRNPPFTSGEDHRSQLDPKAALVWEATPQITLRGIYAQSLGGAGLDESYRLEPTELAGFPQTFRTLIPESVAGSVDAPAFEIYGSALDLKLSTNTFATLQVEQLNSKVRRTDGEFTLEDSLSPFVADATPENLDYREFTIKGSLNRILGNKFVAGISYSLDDVKLGDVLPDVPVAAMPAANQQDRARLQEGSAYLLFNDPSGFYARLDATCYHQYNSGYSPGLPGDEFIQENIYAGYRFLNRRCEFQIGILNLGGQNYQLNPLNVYAELPRERTLEARLKFIF